MVRVELETQMNATPDRVWEFLTGGGLQQAILEGYGEKIEVEGEGIGMVMTTHLKAGGRIQERIEALDPQERYMSYRLIDSGPMPYADYVGEMRVSDCGPGQSKVRVACKFNPVGADEETCRRDWLDRNTEEFNRIAAMFAARK